MRVPSGLKGHLLAFAAFTLLALAITAPLVTCLGSCLGESSDPIFTVWGFGWIARSVFGPEQLYDANMFHPYRATLALSEPSLSNGLAAAPLIAATHNPILGYNSILILQYAVAAFGAYLVVWEVLGRRGPALVAGTVFAMSSFLVHNAYNLQSFAVLWVAYLAVAIQRFIKNPSYANSILLWGLALVLAVTSVYYTLYGGLALLSLLAVLFLFRACRIGVLHLKRFALVAPPFLVTLGFAYRPYWIWAREHHQVRRLEDVERFRATLDNYSLVAPTNLVHRSLGWWKTTGTDDSAAFPGIVISLLALLAVVAALRELTAQPDVARRTRAIAGLSWASFCVFSFVMAFGPTLRLGQLVLPLPYRLFFEVVPGMSALRTANRFLGLVTLGVAVLSALGVDRLATWASTRVSARAKSLLVGVTLALGLAELACYPYPGTTRTFAGVVGPDHLAFIAWLKTRPGNPSVVTLPMRESATYDAAVTANRFVNGWSSFNPPHYDEVVKGMDKFPSSRSLDLLSALPVDLVLLDGQRSRRAASSPHARRLLEPLATFGDLQVFAKTSTQFPRDDLTFAARLEPSSAPGAATIAVELVNPRAQALALYPKHRLEVALSGADASPSAQRELGLWIRPGRSAALSLVAPVAQPSSSTRPLRLRWKLSASGMADRSGELQVEEQPPASSTGAPATP
ncbi:MAG TPA: hypothetical protein VJV79_20810 [Polyangiaceae bacterium]|nr:hypothetical protein [Polyangiaceae bacterium]